MTATAASEADAFKYISSLIYDRCRIRLDQGKHALIKARLGKRMRLHGFSGLQEYCRFLQTAAAEEEFTRVVDALTTNFTHFMREPDHFEFLTRSVLPEWRAKGGKRLRVWSAACSSGEEPYTIAFHLAELQAELPGWDWSIIASDVSTKVLEKARAGVYDAERVSALPREWLPRYFQKGVGKWDGYYRVKKAVSSRLEFRQINLIEACQHDQPFDVIFCRNVMIYFDRPTQEEIVRRLCQFLAPSGCLIIGHSESLNAMKAPLRCVKPSIYQKI